MNHITFHKLAKREFFDARDRYDELALGIGKIFVGEIEKCLNVIKTNPLAYPMYKDNIRKAVILKFPYSLLYRIGKK